MVLAERILDGETAIRLLLMEREGGESEVTVPVGRVDLVTDEYVIEIKAVSKWMDSLKVLLYSEYFPGKKPRVHLFGPYARETKELVERHLNPLGITVTWEQQPFNAE
jgi:hypothetical protein